MVENVDADPALPLALTPPVKAVPPPPTVTV
jgi:hypothetical protein